MQWFWSRFDNLSPPSSIALHSLTPLTALTNPIEAPTVGYISRTFCIWVAFLLFVYCLSEWNSFDDYYLRDQTFAIFCPIVHPSAATKHQKKELLRLEFEFFYTQPFHANLQNLYPLAYLVSILLGISVLSFLALRTSVWNLSSQTVRFNTNSRLGLSASFSSPVLKCHPLPSCRRSSSVMACWIPEDRHSSLPFPSLRLQI